MGGEGVSATPYTLHPTAYSPLNPRVHGYAPGEGSAVEFQLEACRLDCRLHASLGVHECTKPAA